MNFSIAAPVFNELSAGADNPRTLTTGPSGFRASARYPRDGQHSPAAREARTNGDAA